MKREQFSLNAVTTTTDGSQLPALEIDYDGSLGPLLDRLSGERDWGDADDIDVGFRLRGDRSGVLSVADRLTGTFVCEVDAETDLIDDIVSAAEAGDDRYRLEIAGREDTWAVEKRTLLVYGVDGQLLRTRSLIPGSVEL